MVTSHGPGIKLTGTHFLVFSLRLLHKTSLLKIYTFIDYVITVVPFFPPLYPPLPYTPSPHQHPCPTTPFVPMGHTYKFFNYSISYTILNLPLSILYLQFMLLIPCTFSPILPLSLPTDNPPCFPHFCDSVPVIAVCLVCFCFCLFRFNC